MAQKAARIVTQASTRWGRSSSGRRGHIDPEKSGVAGVATDQVRFGDAGADAVNRLRENPGRPLRESR
jgi:hypothetical protein